MRSYLKNASSIEYDSRKVDSSSVFFALPGLHTHGNRHIIDALNRGACAIIYEDALKKREEEAAKLAKGVLFLQVSNVREEMAWASAEFYGEPSKHLVVIGVTGTEGKSSTVSFIWQLLRSFGQKAGYFSTVSYSYGEKEEKNPAHQTTPESNTVNFHLANMVKNGCAFAVVESSSHGLSKKTARLSGVNFDVAVFLNVRHEHLEFHKTFECYRDDKANLLRALDECTHEKIICGQKRHIPSFALVFADDPSCEYMKSCTQKKCFSFGEDASSDYKISNIKEEKEEVSFLLQSEGEECALSVPFSGAFNAYNVTASLACVTRLLERHLKEADVSSLKAINGRFMHVKMGQPFEVIIDYAHTPSSFMTIFPPLRSRVSGRIIALFGSAGERDTEKREMQGEIAAKYADILYLTDEDPRGEDENKILRDISMGALKGGKTEGENLFLLPDRKRAIRQALFCAKKGDVVLFLGKSHENSIIYRDEVVAYSEEEEVKSALCEMGFGEEK